MRVRVSEVMTSEVVSVTAATPFKDVAEALLAHGVSAVPVVDGDGRIEGIVREGRGASGDRDAERPHDQRSDTRTFPGSVLRVNGVVGVIDDLQWEEDDVTA